MGRSLKYEIPGRDTRVSATEVVAAGWSTLFDDARTAAGELAGPSSSRGRVLEIGFGRGEFLLALAARSPEVDFVGIEVSFKRTLKMARKVAAAKYSNILLLEARAEVAIRELFRESSLDEVWINFSDPWPKARHAHRRLIQADFVCDVARALRDGGMLHVATDDVSYAHQIDGVLAGAGSLSNHYSPWPYLPEVPGRMRTGYEEQWRAAGRPLHFFAYEKRPMGTQAGCR